MWSSSWSNSSTCRAQQYTQEPTKDLAFNSEEFAGFGKAYSVSLNLTAPYHQESSGSAERVVGILKQLLKKTQTEGSCFETAFAAFKNTFCGAGASGGRDDCGQGQGKGGKGNVG